ncbi:MAG: T9SS type A sorting domain-containing protein, partial [Ignavibacteriaceae bacterium]|nr:T9SS type A sorting domain-containing protein [Ignavibacteriaceae bacterium]
FDTETGLSAIGRFGLMDGQSIFAYLGTYPPEPSPWEKIRLGWAEPVTLNIQNADVSLVTNLAASISDTVILKVPLNSSEYYLIENRIRDAYENGSTITYAIGDVVITKTFPNDTTGYLSFDVDSLSGVIIDVDEFDWAVPGNGIVIWHIDENIINEKIEENKVNTDKTRRGVDVEEADGVQDIGERFFTIFGDEVIGEGTEEDFWHKDNPATLFENRFAKDTRPNTLTNTGANSLITIKNFSEIDNRMSFSVEFGDSVVKPLFSKDLPYLPNSFVDITILKDGLQSGFCLRNYDDDIRIFNSQGDLIDSVFDFSYRKPAAIYLNGLQYLVGVLDSILKVQVFEDQNKFAGNVNAGVRFTSPPVISTNINGEKIILIGTEDGRILIYSLIFSSGSNPILLETIDTGIDEGILQLAANDQYWVAITNSGAGEQSYLIDALGNQVAFARTQFPKLLLTKDQEGQYISILSSDKTIITVKNGEIFSLKNIDGDILSGINTSLGDLKNDGTNYVLYTTVPQINAINFSGFLADNFPYSLSQGLTFLGISLTADFEGDAKSEITTTTIDGRIFAIDGGTGKVLSGFPISCGVGFPKHILYNANGKTNLAVLNDQNVLSAWSISSVEGKLYWSEEYGNPQNTSFIDAAENTNRINEFFPSSRAYNYPNPVYEGTTNIRYYVAEDSKINIKIFDLAGDFVAELNDEAQGGMDNETVWNVGDIQSGVYLARIEAVCDCGKTEQAVIKIAVVK